MKQQVCRTDTPENLFYWRVIHLCPIIYIFSPFRVMKLKETAKDKVAYANMISTRKKPNIQYGFTLSVMF